MNQEQKHPKQAARGKYHKLYTHLRNRPAQTWRTTFSEVESILGFKLPASARHHRPWWANQTAGTGHSYALAWTAAGWETAEVDMVAETLSFKPSQRLNSPPTLNFDEVWPARSVGAWPEGLSLRRENIYEERTFLGRTFAGYTFDPVGPIQLERDERGEVTGHLPQSRFSNERNLPLNKYGAGPFCRFRVAKGWHYGGVYILTNGNDPLYVGECENLERRWGSQGYGNISPRNCYKGGQETNCRINNLIFVGAKSGAEFGLWFRAVDGDKHARRAIESELISFLLPPWNR